MKDNTVKAELIFWWALEGGGENVFGIKDSDGNWQKFWVEGSSFGLDDNDEEVINCWKRDEVETIEEALNLLYEDWWQFAVREIHPEFESKINNYISTKKSE